MQDNSLQVADAYWINRDVKAKLATYAKYL